MKRIGLAFNDEHPERNRLHRETVQAINDLAGTVVDVVTPASANTEFAVRHPDLGHKATEVHILLQDSPGKIYRSSPTKWTKDVSFFKYDQSGVNRLTLRLR